MVPTPSTPTTSRLPAKRADSRNRWLLVRLLLVPAVVAAIVASLYDRADPYFFWVQVALIPFAAVLTVAAFFLAMSADREDRGED